MSGLMALAAAAAVATGAPSCDHDRQALLALPYLAFDEDEHHGWRSVADREGCEVVAADLIAAYRAANASRIVEDAPDHLRTLNWHEAQLRAAAGQIAAATALFIRGARIPDDIGDSYYQQATVAYITRNKPALLKLRAQIAAQPKPDWFERTAQNARAKGIEVASWPPHLATVDGLIACFDKPYAEAYSRACQPAASPPQ